MSTPDPPSIPNDPPPPTPSPGPSSPPKGKFGKLLQHIRVASRSLRTSSKFTGRVVDVTKTLTKLAGDAAGDAGVPGLAAGIGVLDVLLEKIQTMSDNIEGVDSLKERIEILKADMATFDSLPPGQALPQEMQQRIADLVNTWATIGQSAQHIADRGRFKRFLKSSTDAEDLEDLVGKIKTSIDNFMLHEALIVGRNVHQVHQMVTAMTAILEESFMPTYAKRAQYNASSVRRPCLPNTRVAILNMVQAWIAVPGTQGAVQSVQDGIVYWINGLAGTGKTTIAYSIAVWCKDQGVLGASFFCSRQDVECRDPNLIFVTICRQLCQFHAPFKAEVVKVLQEDPSVVHSSPTEQFERLILKPLEALKDTLPKMVLVIDALDECEDEGAPSAILTVLAQFAPRMAERLHRSLLLVLTSRPEVHVTALFKESAEESLHDTTTPLLLHMVALESVNDDIKQCIRHEFKVKAALFKREKGWPFEQDINELTELAGGLFILATTAVRFIMDIKQASVPQERLRALLQSRSVSRTPRAVLDVLYTQIAQAASPLASDTSKASTISLRHILGSIALAREPLSSSTLGGILGISPADVCNTLVGLHSVLHIPEDDNEAIRVIHPTFPEFLLATYLVKPGDFCIIASEQHAFLFERNLQTMKALKRNIAGFPSHLLRKDEVPTLKADVERCIPPHLSYATRHWTAHLDGATSGSTLAGARSAFDEFIHHRLLYWLEASSLLDTLEGATSGLNVARIACWRIGDAFSAFVPLLADSRRFALASFACIDTTPLELYHSGLAFAPNQSLVKQVYCEELRKAPITRRGVVPSWGPFIMEFNTEVNEGATCIDFSPDGSHYVDRGSSIRNLTTQKVLTILDPQSSYIVCAAFCPDGQYIAMVSSERRETLDVWHLTSGERVHSFEDHGSDIKFVTYSADARYILSADKDEVRLWGVPDRHSLLALPWDLRYPRIPWGIALSPDGAVMALPDPVEDYLYLYSVASQASERLPLPGKMRTAAFSLDGRYVAAGTDTTISVWTLVNRSPAHLLDIPALPYRLAFSADSTRLGVGLRDGSIYLWQMEFLEPPIVLRGETRAVQNIVWSLDDSQIISVSYSNTVRIWDATRSPVADEQPQLPTDTISLPASLRPTVLCKRDGDLRIFHLPGSAPFQTFRTPDDAPTMTLHADIIEAWDATRNAESPHRLVTATMLQRARDWELLTGQRHIHSYDRDSHSLDYQVVALSQDAAYMAYVTPSNRTIQVNNIHTGAIVGTLYTESPLYMAISPNGTLLAAIYKSLEVRVWNVATEVPRGSPPVASHTTHTWQPTVAVFSTDGRLLLSGDDHGVVCIFALTEKRTLHTLTFHGDRILVVRVAFSADDTHVIALSAGSDALIGDTVTGVVIHQVSLKSDAWTRILEFAPDYAGFLVHAEDGQVHKIKINQTEPRIWPLYCVSDDGWVTARSPGVPIQRICWLPPEWRTVFSLGGSFFCTMDLERERSVVIDVSAVEGLEVDLPLVTKTDLTS